MEALRDALVAVRTGVLHGLALAYRRDSAVALVGTVTAIVVGVAKPGLQDTLVVRTLELVRFTFSVHVWKLINIYVQALRGSCVVLRSC